VLTPVFEFVCVLLCWVGFFLVVFFFIPLFFSCVFSCLFSLLCFFFPFFFLFFVVFFFFGFVVLWGVNRGGVFGFGRFCSLVTLFGVVWGCSLGFHEHLLFRDFVACFASKVNLRAYPSAFPPFFAGAAYRSSYDSGHCLIFIPFQCRTPTPLFAPLATLISHLFSSTPPPPFSTI